VEQLFQLLDHRCKLYAIFAPRIIAGSTFIAVEAAGKSIIRMRYYYWL
jgi:hypothetical protein